MIATQTSSYQYETVSNDPLGVRIYTLKNGLKVFLTVNTNEPRIFTNIAFRAGSKYDPADTTGLAHYMEHMLFKGTNKIGATNWEEESQYLEKIAELFEVYRRTDDDNERRKLYAQIDQLSNDAAKLVAPNEYDKLVTAIGGKQTNAYTWVEQTVYVNDIPSNELERWLKLERERFGYLALRLFHTELETVFEEFNMSQVNDNRQANNKLRELLFKKHPYGTQTTLGDPEHLKNPSMREIDAFFAQYYVPNNMAISLSGEFDPDTTIALIDQYFGNWEAKEFQPFAYEPEEKLTSVVRADVYGQDSPFLEMGWRLGGGKTEDYIHCLLFRQLLHNQQAGLMDLNLIQEQRVLDAEAFTWIYEDYSIFGLYGEPREGQSLEELEQLLLAEIEKLRKGDFPDWLLEASIRDMMASDMKAMESNKSRVAALTNYFVLGLPWQDFVQRYETVAKYSKADIVRLAQEKLDPKTYAAVYKKQGENKNLIKVDKPKMTAVPLQREATSEYAQSFLSTTPPEMKPVFADFKSLIQREEWQKGLYFDYVHNPHNQLFRLDYIYEWGKSNDLLLPLAMVYLPYLGTSRYSAASLQQEFFRLGLEFDVYSYDERCHITLKGLESSLEAGLALVEHYLSDVKVDKFAWNNVVKDVLMKRQNQQQNKNVIFRAALSNFAHYGIDSSFNDRMTSDDLRNADPKEIIHALDKLKALQHRVYYYGQMSASAAAQIIKKHHSVPSELKKPSDPKQYKQLATEENRTFFVDFPMVQADLMLTSRGTPKFNLQEHTITDIFNEYFGYGLSSIVFQEIREAKALAYSTYAYYSSPSEWDTAHYFKAYVGTQPDKVLDALTSMQHIIENMPLLSDGLMQAQRSLLQRVESDRISPRKLYWEAQEVKDVGYEHDLLKDVYERTQNLTPEEFYTFYEKQVKGRNYNLLLMGDRKNLPMTEIEKSGPIIEVKVEDLFKY